jgi:uncharacterized protein (TIGR03437 family)
MRHACGLLLFATLTYAYPPRVESAAGARFDVNELAVIAPGMLISVAPYIGELALSPIDATKKQTITIQSGNTVLEAQVLQVSPEFVTAVVPSTIPLGVARLSLNYTGTRGDAHTTEASVNIVHSNFGLFYGSAQNNMQDGPRPNRPENPTRPGQFVTLWGTGLGDAGPGDVSVLLGGKPVVPSFVGHAPALPGVDQIDFQIPDDSEIPDDCSLAVAVKVGAEISKIRTISKTTDGGPCYYLPRFGLSGAQRAELDAGSLPFGYVDVTNTKGSYPFFSVWAEFGTVDTVEFASQFAPVFANGFKPDCVDTSIPRPLMSTRESLGNAITLTGQGQTVSVGHTLPGDSNTYSLFFQSAGPIVAGEWKFSIPGEGSVLAFSTTVNLPPAIDVLNLDQLQAIDRSRDLEVRWNPSGYSQRDTVQGSLSLAPGYGEPGFNVQCSAAAADALLTIPQRVLAEVPLPSQPTQFIAQLSSSSSFSIPRKDGADLMIIFTYQSQTSTYYYIY